MAEAMAPMDDQQMDVLREIGNIGAGNAATALASMLNKKIDMNVPEVQMVPFNSVVNILNGPESLVTGILVQLKGDLNGYILLILGMKDAFEMSSMILGEDRPILEEITINSFTELELSALQEIANILTGAYLSAICSLTGLKVSPSVPAMAIDMVGAIISIVAIEYGKIGDSVLFLKTQFSDISKKIDGHFFLIPEHNSYKILMESLGMNF